MSRGRVKIGMRQGEDRGGGHGEDRGGGRVRIGVEAG